MLAVSNDDLETLRGFRASLEAPFQFASDPEGRVAALYQQATGTNARRLTVDIDTDGRIVHVSQGASAILPAADIKACPLDKRPASPADSSI